MAFWEQAVRQGKQVGRRPLLIFKYDRSKVFVAIDVADFVPTDTHPYVFVCRDQHSFYVMLLEDWLVNDIPKFVT